MKDSLISETTQRALNWGAWAVVAMSLLSSLWLATPAHAQGRDVAWQEATIPTPDGALAFAKAGRGPLLVVVPGGPGASGASLRDAFAPLTRHATVVLLDPIGRGRSGRLADARRYTVARDAADLEQLRLHFGVSQISVYGHSYGGLVAQQYAADRPQNVRRLVLGNTLHGAQAWHASIDLLAQEMRRQHPQDWRRRLAEQVAPRAAGSVASADFNPDVYRAMLGADADWRITGSLRDVELLQRLREVTAPTLVLTGRRDRVAPPQVARQMAQALLRSRASLLVFEGSAHEPFTDEPEAWAQAVRTFLR
jgi:proline iminopeptidase